MPPTTSDRASISSKMHARHSPGPKSIGGASSSTANLISGRLARIPLPSTVRHGLVGSGALPPRPPARAGRTGSGSKKKVRDQRRIASEEPTSSQQQRADQDAEEKEEKASGPRTHRATTEGYLDQMQREPEERYDQMDVDLQQAGSDEAPRPATHGAAKLQQRHHVAVHTVTEGSMTVGPGAMHGRTSSIHPPHPAQNAPQARAQQARRSRSVRQRRESDVHMADDSGGSSAESSSEDERMNAGAGTGAEGRTGDGQQMEAAR